MEMLTLEYSTGTNQVLDNCKHCYYLYDIMVLPCNFIKVRINILVLAKAGKLVEEDETQFIKRQQERYAVKTNKTMVR